MKKLKNRFSNKIIIYQENLADRISIILAGLLFTILPVYSIMLRLYNNEKELMIILIFLFVMVIFDFFSFFIAFKTYICLDFNIKKLTIREYPGLKKYELDLSIVKEIKISDGIPFKYKKFFTIDIICTGYTKKIDTWSTGPGSLPFLGTKQGQRKRLEKFCDKCNKYLKNKSQDDFNFSLTSKT